MWGSDEQETLCKLQEWNQPIHRVRGRIEKIFGTWKRCYGQRRMRWRSLAKAAVQVHLTAIAYISRAPEHSRSPDKLMRSANGPRGAGLKRLFGPIGRSRSAIAARCFKPTGSLRRSLALRRLKTFEVNRVHLPAHGSHSGLLSLPITGSARASA